MGNMDVERKRFNWIIFPEFTRVELGMVERIHANWIAEHELSIPSTEWTEQRAGVQCYLTKQE